MTKRQNTSKNRGVVRAGAPVLIWVGVIWPQPTCIGVSDLEVKDHLSDRRIEAPFVTSDPQPTLDELLNIAPRPQRPSDFESSQPEVVKKNVNDRLSGIEVSGEFAMALRDMEQASTELSDRLNPGVTTQRLQEAAMRKLESLIADAKRQYKARAGGSSGQQDARGEDIGTKTNAARRAVTNSRQPAENPGGFSPGAVGPAGTNLGPLAETRDQWGDLPPRLREQLIQGMRERFSLIYRSLTEDYYRCLAEEAQP